LLALAFAYLYKFANAKAIKMRRYFNEVFFMRLNNLLQNLIKYLFIFALFLCAAIFINIKELAASTNSNAGKNGAAFLKIPVGARPCAFGGAYTAVSGDIYSAYFNPAGLSDIEKFAIAFQHNDWLLDIKHEFLGVGARLDKNTAIVLSAIIMNLGEESQTKEDALGRYTGIDGKWSASDMALGLSVSRKLNPALSLGCTGKYIKQEIAGYNATAFGFDVGIISSFIEQDIKFGVTIQNVGTKLKFIDDRAGLPLIYRAGVSYTLSGNLFFTGDIVKPDDNNVNLILGAEYSLSNMFALRAGWKSDDDLSNSGISAGLGFKYNNLSIDYSFEPKENFGDIHRFSLDCKF